MKIPKLFWIWKWHRDWSIIRNLKCQIYWNLTRYRDMERMPLKWLIDFLRYEIFDPYANRGRYIKEPRRLFSFFFSYWKNR